MVGKFLVKTSILLALFIFSGATVFAQQYYVPQNAPAYNQYYQNYNQPTYDPYYQNYNQPVYNQYAPPNYNQAYNPNYNPNYNNYNYANETKREKIKKALQYSALGAGAGYMFSRDGKKAKNSLVGAGIGAALGYFLNKY